MNLFVEIPVDKEYLDIFDHMISYNHINNYNITS